MVMMIFTRRTLQYGQHFYKLKYIVLIWLLSRFIFMSLSLDIQMMRVIYFISNDIFNIGFFVLLTKIIVNKNFVKIVYAALFFSYGMLIDDVLLFASIGNISRWYYELCLLSLTIIGYVYGASINQLTAKGIW